MIANFLLPEPASSGQSLQACPCTQIVLQVCHVYVMSIVVIDLMCHVNCGQRLEVTLLYASDIAKLICFYGSNMYVAFSGLIVVSQTSCQQI